MMSFPDWLDHGALGASMLVLLFAVTLLFKVLLFVRELVEIILQRIQANTRALAQLSAQLEGHVLVDGLPRGILPLRPRRDGGSGKEES